MLGLCHRLGLQPMMSAKFSSRVNFVSKKNLTDLIAEDQLPESLGGKYKFSQQQFIKDRYKKEGFEYSSEVEDMTERFSKARIAAKKGNDPGKPKDLAESKESDE